MRRTVSLPEPVDADTVTTAYRRGVVQVVVEKTVAETPDAVQRN
jgi:HSP20 family molecular chaperone IbpA